MKRLCIWVTFSFLFLSGCASVSVDDPDADFRHTEETASIRQCSGENAGLPVALLPLGLGKRASERYPELVKQSVGAGLYQMLMAAATETNCFLVLENRSENIEKILQERWLRGTGLMSSEEAVRYAEKLHAGKVIYGVVYDYSSSSRETIRGFKVHRDAKKRVGIQIVCTDVRTRRQIGLASSVAYGDNILEASNRAIRKALDKLIASDNIFNK
jgi:curli biogenesis system outer membrane secretion channel CsgG